VSERRAPALSSPKKIKIKRKITSRKKMKSRMKIKSRIPCTRHACPALSHALALNLLPNLTLHLTLSLLGERLVNPSIAD